MRQPTFSHKALRRIIFWCMVISAILIVRATHGWGLLAGIVAIFLSYEAGFARGEIEEFYPEEQKKWWTKK